MYHSVFKRLDSRHIHEEIEMHKHVYVINKMLCKTDPTPIERYTHKCNIINDVHLKAL